MPRWNLGLLLMTLGLAIGCFSPLEERPEEQDRKKGLGPRDAFPLQQVAWRLPTVTKSESKGGSAGVLRFRRLSSVNTLRRLRAINQRLRRKRSSSQESPLCNSSAA